MRGWHRFAMGLAVLALVACSHVSAPRPVALYIATEVVGCTYTQADAAEEARIRGKYPGAEMEFQRFCAVGIFQARDQCEWWLERGWLQWMERQNVRLAAWPLERHGYCAVIYSAPTGVDCEQVGNLNICRPLTPGLPATR